MFRSNAIQKSLPVFRAESEQTDPRNMRLDVPLVEIPVSLDRARSLVRLDVRKIDQVNELLDGLRVGGKALIDWLKVSFGQWTDTSQCAILVGVVGQFDRDLFTVRSVAKVPGSVTPKDLTFLHADIVPNVQRMCNRLCRN